MNAFATVGSGLQGRKVKQVGQTCTYTCCIYAANVVCFWKMLHENRIVISMFYKSMIQVVKTRLY